MFQPVLRILLVVAAGVACRLPLLADTPAPPASPWRSIRSDLPQDPRLIDRTLPNGVRYLILPNDEPKDHVSLRLIAAVGSLHENDDERGLAHFVEHMAFRGTRDYPNGKMTEALQRLGIDWGPDSTAFTTYDHTIYHLELPNAHAPTLALAFHALREYASGVTFTPDLIERERGVVLSEMATRDTPEARAGDCNLNLLWPGSRVVRRKVIGDAIAIRTFTQAAFVSFYNAWYRPERLGLIVVGSADPAQIEALIRKEFGPLVAREPARPDPPDLTATDCAPADVGVYRDPATVGFWIGFERAKHRPAERDTHANRVKDLHQALAFSMLQHRLRKLENEGGTSYVGSSASVQSGLTDWELATVGANGRISDWRQVAAELEVQHRRAVQYGFTPAELTEVRAAFTMSYEEAVRSAPTRASPALAQQLVQTLLYGNAFTPPAEIQRDLAPDLAAATLADCLTAFRATWLPGAPTVFVVANSSLDTSRDELAAVLNASRSQRVTRPADVPLAEFAYTSFGPTGKLARDDFLPDLNVHLSEFENHAKLNFKPTKFDADVVEVRVRVGDGKLSQLKSAPGLDVFAAAAFTAGGVGRHTRQQLDEILAGHAVQLGFRADSDALVFDGKCARRELSLMLRIITAFVTDAAYRDDAMRQARAQYGSILASLASSPGGPITASAVRTFCEDDGRFGIPSYDEYAARNLGELRAWVEPQLVSGPIEMSIVGDTTWEEVSTTVATTIGALPSRKPVKDATAAVPVEIDFPTNTIKAYPISQTMKQIALAWYWPVPRVANIHEERRLYLLANLLRERLRIRLREELGATYAPMVGFSHIDGFPNLNYFVFYAEVEPKRAKQALALLDSEAKAMSRSGPSKDEFERARVTYISSMTDDVKTNLYWGDTVLSDAQQRPSRIEAARDRAADLVAITRGEISSLARRYLAPDKAFKFATVPASR